MRNRISAIVAAITAGVLVTGISWAASDTESNTNISLDINQETEVPVDDAGVIRLGNDGLALTILAAVAAEGYVVEVEVPQGREVEADFRGEGRRLQFNAELEDGVITVRIRTEANANAGTSTTATFDDSTTSSSTTSTETTNGPTSTTATTNTTSTSTTSTTIDDRGGDAVGNIPVGPVVYDVSGAATVTVVFSTTGQIELDSVNPAAAWSVEETRDRDDEVEVRLRNGEEEARLRVRINDGQVRVEVERKD